MKSRLAHYYVLLIVVFSILAMPQSSASSDEQPPKIVKIVLKQTCDGKEAVITTKEKIAPWFRCAGIDIDNDENAEGTLTITIEGVTGKSEYNQSMHDYVIKRNIKISLLFEGKGAEYKTSCSHYGLLQTKEKKDKEFRFTASQFSDGVYGSLNMEMGRMMGHIYGIDALIAAVKTRGGLLIMGSIPVLAEMGDPRAVEPLISVLNDSMNVEDIVSALDKLDPDWRDSEATRQKVSELITDLTDENVFTREWSARCLGFIHHPDSLEALYNSLKDPVWDVREYVIRALGQFNDPQTIEPLITMLKDRELKVVEAAGETLNQIDFNWRKRESAKNIVSELAIALKDPDQPVQQSTIITLVVIANPEAIKLFLEVRNDPDPEIQKIVKDAESILASMAMQYPEKWQEYLDSIQDGLLVEDN